MDPDRLHAASRAPLDDAALAAVVRDVADDWQMPPQRLDALTWRERVTRRRGSSSGDGSGIRWTRRLFGAATLAIAATVSLSFVAVWLTAPRRDQAGSGPAVSASPSSASHSTGPSDPAASAVPVGTPLPRLVRNGDLPTPSTVMVSTGGRFRVADLATGTLAPEVIAATTGPSTIMARPGGGWVCICTDWTQTAPGAANGLRLSLDVVDATGASVERRVLRELDGTYDPGESTSLQPQLVDARVTATVDGRYALIGSSRRDGAAGWVLGVDVLDLSTLEVVGSRQLILEESVALEGQPRTRVAPLANLSPSGRTLLLTSFWYVEDPNVQVPISGTDHWIAAFEDGVIAKDAVSPDSDSWASAAGSTDRGDCPEYDAGLIDETRYYTSCWGPSGRPIITRLGIDGSIIGSTEIPADDAPDGASIITRTADALYVWNPFGTALTRVDLGTGEVSIGKPETARAPQGPLDALAALGRRLGRWIAPSVFAKVYLQPGLIASADGTRIYALGITPDDQGPGGSNGVFVFDAATLEPLGHWAPQADMASIGVSADGRFVYGAAVAGIDMAGNESPGAGASITVYDATNGDVRLIAGQLGTADLWLTESTLR